MTTRDDQTRELQDAAQRLKAAIRKSLEDGLTLEEISELLGITIEEARVFADEA